MREYVIDVISNELNLFLTIYIYTHRLVQLLALIREVSFIIGQSLAEAGITDHSAKTKGLLSVQLQTEPLCHPALASSKHHRRGDTESLKELKDGS